MNSLQGVLYCPAAYKRISAGEEYQLVQLLLQNRTVFLPIFTGHVLEACHGFQTIATHLNNACNKFMRVDERTVEKHIYHLIKMDLLLPCASAIPRGARSNRTALSTLGIITADREQECLRAFGSYSDHLRRHSRTTTVTVMDDSRHPNNLREKLESLTKTTGRGIRYAGHAEKEAYVNALAKEGIENAVSEFAIVGHIHPDICSIGANRNALILDTVGQSVFSVDDDTVCAIRPHPDRTNGVRFTCLRNPRDTWFYSERTELIAEAGWGDFDLLGEHEELLGETASRLAHRGGIEKIEGDHVCGALFYALQSGYGRVLVTMSGIAGDSGAYSSKAVMGGSDGRRRRLDTDEPLFRIALNSREILGVVKTPTVDPNSFCMGTAFAFSNEYVIPPFNPVGRNEDGVFGKLLNMAAPHALLGHIPLAVLHDARLGRKYVQYPEFRISDLMLSLLKYYEPREKMPVPALLMRLGRQLIEISTLSSIDLRDLISEAVVAREARKIQRTSTTAKTSHPGASEHFKEELDRYRQRLICNVTSDMPIVPVELRNAYGRDANIRMREYLSLVGRVYYNWPAILEAAHHLRKTGIRLSNIVKA